MLLDNRPYTLDRIVRIGIAAGLVWGVIWLLGYLSDVLLPFAVALLLAYLINPMVNLVQKKVSNRLVAVLITLTALLVAVAAVLAVVAPMVVMEIRNASAVVVKVVDNSNLSGRLGSYVPPEVWQAVRDFLESGQVQDFLKTDNFLSLVQAAARRILPGVWGVISGTTSAVFGIIGLSVILLYLVFLLMDYQKVRQGWTDFIPPAYKSPVLDFLSDFNQGMHRYFRGQALVAGIVGVLHAIGFSLIGLPLGILVGLLVGLLNMVPYLQILGMIPAFSLAVIHALATGGSILTMVLLTALVFAVIQALQDAFLVPKIMGNVTGLSPAMILLSLSIWGKLLGIFGLLIALPMTCLLLAYYKRFISHTQFVLEPAHEGSGGGGTAPEMPWEGGAGGKKA